MCILMPLNMMLNKTNYWLLYMSIRWPLSGTWPVKAAIKFRPSQSEGLATRDDLYSSRMCFIIVILRVCRGIGGIIVVQSNVEFFYDGALMCQVS